MKPHNETAYDRPCCLLLKKTSKARSSLSDPKVCTELLACLSKHCVLMKQQDASRVKLDHTEGQCYFLVDPISTRKILNDVSETVTLESMTDYYVILNEIESAIAKNPLLKEIVDHFTEFLATLRSGERKFGTVPETIEKNIVQSPELSDNQKFVQDHPRLGDKPQFDGAPPSQTPIANENSKAVEQINRLQNQHQAKPAFNPRPQMP
jgi:hypothetical protein